MESKTTVLDISRTVPRGECWEVEIRDLKLADLAREQEPDTNTSSSVLTANSQPTATATASASKGIPQLPRHRRARRYKMDGNQFQGSKNMVIMIHIDNNKAHIVEDIYRNGGNLTPSTYDPERYSEACGRKYMPE